MNPRSAPLFSQSVPRRRLVFVLTYANAIASVATLTWATVGWKSVLMDRGTGFDFAPRILLVFAAVLTLALTFLGLHYIHDRDLHLFREESGPINAVCLVAVAAVAWQAGELSAVWLDAPLAGRLMPALLGGILGVIFIFRLMRLHELPSRYELHGKSRRPPQRRDLGLLALAAVFGVAGYLAADTFGLGQYGWWVPPLAGLALAYVFARGLQIMFHPPAEPLPAEPEPAPARNLTPQRSAAPAPPPRSGKTANPAAPTPRKP